MNAFTSMELNAYGILHLITKFRDANQSELFLPALFSSQPCEHVFRQFRSMTTANWTRINFTMHELLQMIGRIDMQNDIAYSEIFKQIVLPRIQNRPEKHKLFTLPSNSELQTTLDEACKTALIDASEFGINVTTHDISFCELSKGNMNIEPVLKHVGNTDSMLNSELIDSDVDVVETLDCTYFRDYSDEIGEIDGNSPFVNVFHKDGTEKKIKKGALVWRVTQSTKPLSKDRTLRVQAEKNSKIPKTSTDLRTIHQVDGGLCTSFHIMDRIQIGDYCIFRKNSDYSNTISVKESLENCVIGMVLAFRYINGKTKKDKQYTLNDAPIFTDSLNKRGLEVLSLWYGLNTDLSFKRLPIQSFFINIENYVANINTPETTQDPITKHKYYKIKENVNEILSFLTKN